MDCAPSLYNVYSHYLRSCCLGGLRFSWLVSLSKEKGENLGKAKASLNRELRTLTVVLVRYVLVVCIDRKQCMYVNYLTLTSTFSDVSGH